MKHNFQLKASTTFFVCHCSNCRRHLRLTLGETAFDLLVVFADLRLERRLANAARQQTALQRRHVSDVVVVKPQVLTDVREPENVSHDVTSARDAVVILTDESLSTYAEHVRLIPAFLCFRHSLLVCLARCRRAAVSALCRGVLLRFALRTRRI